MDEDLAGSQLMMLSGEKYHPSGTSKHFKSNFLNRHDRLILQQKKLQEEQTQKKQSQNLLIRKQKPMAVMEEELQQKMRTNQAVKRDIKFACKRSTQHIRTKL